MSVCIDLDEFHHIVAANSHNYPMPTEPLFIDRTMIYHDFIYLIDGEWVFSEQINGHEEEYLLVPGDVLILAAGNHHYTRLPCSAGTKTFCIHVSQEGHDMDFLYEKNVLLPSKIDCHTSSHIFSLFKDIVEGFWADEPYRLHKLNALFSLLVCELSGILYGKPVSEKVDEAIRLINRMPHQTLTALELGNLLHIDGKKFSRTFRAETGQTVHSYQINRKLEMVALQLEIEPDIRLKELAATFGFYDEFYLSKLFKKKYHVSPLHYKQSLPVSGKVK